MKRWRVRICRFTPIAVLLFAAGVAVPRQVLVFHAHAGGDHFHVHGDELTGEEHDAAAQHAREHHHGSAAAHPHAAAVDHDGAAFEAPEPVHLGHWHAQHPFHRVVAPAVTTLVAVFAIASIATVIPLDVLIRLLPPDRARGPPTAALG